MNKLILFATLVLPLAGYAMPAGWQEVTDPQAQDIRSAITDVYNQQRDSLACSGSTVNPYGGTTAVTIYDSEVMISDVMKSSPKVWRSTNGSEPSLALEYVFWDQMHASHTVDSVVYFSLTPDQKKLASVAYERDDTDDRRVNVGTISQPDYQYIPVDIKTSVACKIF